MRILVILFTISLLTINCSRSNKTGDLSKEPISIDQLLENGLIDRAVDLQGKTIKIKNKTLNFKKNGILKNGTIIIESTQIRSNCPNPIFNNISLKGQFYNGEAQLSWFVKSSKDFKENSFTALCTLVSSKHKIIVEGNYYVKLIDQQNFCWTPNDIIIKGNGAENSGLTFLNKQKNPYEAFFRSDYGNNIDLRQISLSYDGDVASYPLILSGGAYSQKLNPKSKANFKFIKMDACKVNGPISIASYSSSNFNQSTTDYKHKNKVKNIKITNNHFFNINNIVSLSNIGYDSVLIVKNNVSNLSGPMIGIAASGLPKEYYPILNKNRGAVVFTDNVINNEGLVSLIKGSTLSPIVIKGGYGSLLYENNTLRNLMSSQSDVQSYAFYYTCLNPGKAIIRNNTFLNVLSYGGSERIASLIKQRGADNFSFTNNHVEITTEALSKLGIIKNSDPKKLLKKDFTIGFMQVGPKAYLERSYTISNNTFITPLLNTSTEITDAASFLFENNNINIEYFGVLGYKGPVMFDNVMFTSNKRINPQNAKVLGNFKSINNRIFIGRVENNQLIYINTPYGVQMGTPDKEDLIYNYKDVEFSDFIDCSSCSVTYSSLDAENLTLNSTLNGKNMSVGILDFENINHQRPSILNLISNIVIEDFKPSESSPFFLLPNSKQKISISGNQSNKVNILSFKSAMLLFNLKKQLPLKVKVDVVVPNKPNLNNSFSFIIEDNYRSVMFSDRNENVVSKSANEPSNSELIFGTKSTYYQLEFKPGNGMKDASSFSLIGCSNIAEMNISLTVVNLKKESYNSYKKVVKNIDR